SIPHLCFIAGRIVTELPKLTEDAPALPLCFPADVLQRFVFGDERDVPIVAELERLLRANERDGFEHALDLARRDDLIGGLRRRRRLGGGLLTRLTGSRARGRERPRADQNQGRCQRRRT